MYVELRRCTGLQDGPEATTPNSNVAGECAISVIPLKAWATSAALNRFDLLEQQEKVVSTRLLRQLTNTTQQRSASNQPV